MSRIQLSTKPIYCSCAILWLSASPSGEWKPGLGHSQ